MCCAFQSPTFCLPSIVVQTPPTKPSPTLMSNPIKTTLQATKKKSKPTQSIPEIPDDVVLEILVRLPLKPLLRFKPVSKSWNQMIKHEDSIDLYHTRCEEAKHSSGSESLFIIN
ncbi:hypothetical protein Droror1_Dr00012817 [Drosera rotundifolia]